jgi:uncharacterized membrane protein
LPSASWFFNTPVMVNFFKKEEEKEIIAAIRAAELNTSGEIRVHLEKDIKGEVTRAAIDTFNKLRMDRTAENNAVLIFLVPSQRQFAIIGDRGINDIVPPGYWNDVSALMEKNFRENKFADGVIEAVCMVGQKLKEYFPWKRDDVNELPDEISYGKK